MVAASAGAFYGQPMTAGDIYTVAGQGQPGFAGDGLLATEAELSGPAAMAAGAAGQLLIADTSDASALVDHACLTMSAARPLCIPLRSNRSIVENRPNPWAAKPAAYRFAPSWPSTSRAATQPSVNYPSLQVRAPHGSISSSRQRDHASSRHVA